MRLWMIVSLFLGWSALAHAEETVDQIFPNDRLSLRVLEWLPAQGTYKSWEAFAGPYVVNPGQTIDLPFAGTVSTLGRSPKQLAGEIADMLFRQLSLPSRPDVTIEFADRAKVYVLGGVATPGPIPFDPELTVTKAIVAAGGYYREATGGMRLERDAISAQGALDLARYRVSRSVARVARLTAEFDEKREVVPDTSNGPIPPDLLQEEGNLLRIRLESRDLRLASIENVRKLASEQATTLREKAGNLDRQIDLTRKELKQVDSLVSRGLAVSGRSFSLELSLADLEGRRLDLDQSILQAELQVSQAERDAIDLRTTFRSDVSRELQTARAELQENLNGVDVARQLLREARVIAPEQILDRAGNLLVEIQILLTRDVNGRAQTREVPGTERVQPGDVIEIQMRPDADNARAAADTRGDSTDAQPRAAVQ